MTFSLLFSVKTDTVTYSLIAQQILPYELLIFAGFPEFQFTFLLLSRLMISLSGLPVNIDYHIWVDLFLIYFLYICLLFCRVSWCCVFTVF